MLEDLGRHEGGPMEKPHIRDLIQKNALESTELERKSRRLEGQKKAFVRASSRDEVEMKHLLIKLQLEQQNAIISADEAAESSDSAEECVSETEQEVTEKTAEPPCNPYPVTIVAKYGPTVTADRDSPRQSNLKCLERNQSCEFEDVQESLHATSSAVSRMSANTSVSELHRSGTTISNDLRDDWVGNPVAISSVRRPRKSVSEQVHQKYLIRSQTELNVLGDPDQASSRPGTSANQNAGGPPSPRSRSNSMKEKRRPGKGQDDSPTRHATGYQGYQRGGSLKERRVSVKERNGNKPVARSFSMLASLSVKDLERPDTRTRKLSKDSISGNSPRENATSHRPSDSMKSPDETGRMKRSPEDDPSDRYHQLLTRRLEDDPPQSRNTLEKTAKPGLMRKNTPPKAKASLGFSNSLDENALRSLGPRTRKQVYKPSPRPIKCSQSDSPDSSPNISPLAKDKTFRY